MYWVLMCLPLLIQTCIQIVPSITNYSFNFDVGLYFGSNLLGIPIYLLIINIIYLKFKNISYTSSIMCMLATILLNVLILLISHKIKSGAFLGDIPEGIVYLLIIIPSIIVLIGIVIFYFVKGR